VRDTGVGLTPEARALLFRSFQQADASTTRKYGGTGLGLAIAKQLAELMGGSVGVESEPGEGSTFWLRARFEKARPRGAFGPARDASHARDADDVRASLTGVRVLLVEDNALNQEVARAILSEVGVASDVAPDGEAAVRMARDGRYDAVLMDVQMPGMDGVMATRILRGLPGWSDVPIIAMTANVMAPDRERYAEAGMNDHVAKPIEPTVLWRTLARWVRPPSLAGVRVLLVEDSELNQEIAIALLGEAGISVDVASDGAIAVRRVQEARYDVVLMDMQMPVMDGIEATRAIRALPAYAELPIIAMTASVDAEERERCIEAGMNDHVAKPIDLPALLRTLARWVRPRA
jgi:two-component system sensor histidine kinase/response regulator